MTLPQMYLHSVAAIADHIIDRLDEASIDELKRLEDEDDLYMFHHGWGTAIRNEFGLWNADHPLTTRWHKFPEQRVIIDGSDHSEDHPDAISMKVMQRVFAKVRA